MARNVLVAAAAVFAVSAPAALAQQGGKPAAKNWIVNCTNSSTDKALDCRISQSIIIVKTKQRLLLVSFRKKPGDELPAMLLQLPHGFFLPDGVRVAIDGKELQKLPVQTCEASGCFAGLAITKEILDQLFKGEEMTFTITNLAKKEIAMRSTLVGFSAAYKQIP